jgi:cytidylate kinase
MSKTNKLIMVRGPAGSGKSTVGKILQKKLGDKTVLISTDQIYFHVLQGKSGTTLMIKCVVNMADFFLKNNYTVILEGTFNRPYNEETNKLEHDKLFALAKKHKMELMIMFLTTTLEKTSERVNQRTGNKKMPYGEIKRSYEKTHKRRHETDFEIDTTNLSPLRVVNRIIKLL